MNQQLRVVNESERNHLVQRKRLQKTLEKGFKLEELKGYHFVLEA